MSILNKNEPDLPNEINVPENEISLKDKTGDPLIERGIPDLHQKKASNLKKLFLAIVGFVALISLFFGSYFFSNTKKVVEEKVVEDTAIKNTHPLNLDSEKSKLVVAATPTMSEAPTSTVGITGNNHSMGMNNTPTPTAPPPAPPPPDRRLLGSVVVDAGKDKGTTADSDTASNGREGRETILSNRLKGTVTTPTTATQRPDLTYLLKKGTNVSCTLDTMIVTTHPGITRCVVSKDVYSANGKTLLIERGSEIIGEQTTALLQGQARVFVLWNTIDTASGVTLDVASPSSDSLGASGQEAQVDNHFWERFGGAIMLSFVQDGLQIVSNTQKQNNSAVTYDNTSNAAQDMASEALKNTINIPPTGYVNQGTLINVMVARDVDFRDVYELVDPYFHKVQ